MITVSVKNHLVLLRKWGNKKQVVLSAEEAERIASDISRASIWARVIKAHVHNCKDPQKA